jgi:hypothetical protein
MSHQIQNILCKVVLVPILYSLLSVILSVVAATASAVVVGVASMLFQDGKCLYRRYVRFGRFNCYFMGVKFHLLPKTKSTQ